MIRHIVLVKLNEGVTPDDPRARQMSEAFATLGEEIPELRAWTSGWNVSPRDVAYDFALIGDVDDQEALARYVAHPAHQAVATLLRQIATLIVADLVV